MTRPTIWSLTGNPTNILRRMAIAGALATGPLAAVTFAPSSAAAADSLKVGYSIRLLGLSMGSAGLNATLSPSSYNMEISAQLSGLASVVSRAQGGARSSGSIEQGRVMSRTYATASSNSKETRTVRMALNSGAVRSVEVSPPLDPHPDRVPVTDAHKRGVIDPLSALVMPVAGRELIGPASCERTIPIFDGYARFDVTLSYAGTQQVRSAAYTGPVAVCKARYKAIAGHRANRKQTNYMENNRQIEVWLMPVEGARVVTPYKIALATQIGQLVIEATRVSVASTGGGSQSASR
ncbi:MAG: DUF3108 domain-containing protein [Beijerinckiaceae bacterium]|nr:DUF3108 domain-containing protein [Beijerinckiaceae bacterium]